ncbi:Pao retrotransposon peptidase family protein [Aphelenchoides avenae]|nr:Pao retrotransposon peptidase family protein [Aphelenchus avenae]
MAPQATITTPQILIGTDYLGEFDIIRRKKKLPNGFFVYDSLVGPLLNGKGKMSWKKGEQDRPQLNMIYRITIDPRPQALQPQDPHKLNIVEQDQLLQATEKMWKTEAIGIESPEAPKAQEDERLLKHFLETLTQSADGRYEVAFPFKEEIVEALKAGMKPSFLLPDNRNAAAARLSSVWKSYLKDNPQVRESYSQAFAEQLARGIIEIVDREHDTVGLRHYLAHHPVFREDKPTKLRIVFDGSARSGPGSRSLNDCLLTGPSLLESLIGILLRSRLSPLLVIGDIEKAFLQISIRPEDRDVTRFLWMKDPSKSPTSDNLVCYRYCRVPFGLNASPFLLLATVQAHLNKLNSPLTEEIKTNSYSDNIFLYAHSTEEAVEKYKEVKGAFSKGQVKVREFISNCPDFNKAVAEPDRAKETKEKTLGHQWCSQRDVWTFTLPNSTPYKFDNKLYPTGSTDPELILQEGKDDNHVMLCRKVKKAKFLTKRLMLSVIHSLWDPLSLLAPVTLQARLRYQSLFDTDLGWDVPEATVRTWEEVTSSWADAQFEVSRFLFHKGRPKSVQLHVFVDASDEAYGACVVPETGSTYCVLLFGKNRVADRKVKLSIPRKELLAAIVGCRVIDFLRKEMLPEFHRQYKLDYIPTYLWGDNQGVLYWIKDSDHTYGRFVQNRLEEIRRTAETEFRYVHTKDNPADVLSRGATVDELKSHALWWTASPWFKEEETLWPSQPSNFQPFSEEILGLDAKPPKEIMSFALQQAQQQDLPASYALQQDQPSSDLFNDIRHTLPQAAMTYPRIQRVMVNVLRFISGRLRAIGREPRLPFLKPYTSAGAEEYSGLSEGYLYLMRFKAAELALVWNAQLIKPPTQNQRIQFNITEGTDGLLRCNGRLVNSGLPRNTINPIWLPEKTWIVRSLVHTIHVLHAHAPIETTLASLRRRFWLVKGRRHVKQIIRKNCTACRMAHGPAFRIPEYANLPAERLQQSRPFTHIGLDLFGPFQIRLGLKAPEQDQQQAQPGRRGRSRNVG